MFHVVLTALFIIVIWDECDGNCRDFGRSCHPSLSTIHSLAISALCHSLRAILLGLVGSLFSCLRICHHVFFLFFLYSKSTLSINSYGIGGDVGNGEGGGRGGEGKEEGGGGKGKGRVCLSADKLGLPYYPQGQ